jgi:hypothetical protein
MNDNSPRVEDERVLVTLENVFHHSDQLNVWLGDIFLTSHNFYYIPYAQFLSHGGQVSVDMASLLGGPAGGLSLSFREKYVRNDAVARAAKRRHIQRGMKLSERLQQNQNVVSVPRQQVIDLNIKETLWFTVGKSTLEFEVPELSKYSNDLLSWLAGSFAE